MPLAPAILVYEKRPRWEAELKRSLVGKRTLVRPCRSVADLLALCRAMPGSVAVIDIEVGGGTVLHALDQAQRERLALFPIVIAPDYADDLEWPLRELGIVALLPDRAPCGELSRACRRWLP